MPCYSISKPSIPEEFLAVYGVGQAKLEIYGEKFLAVIASHEGEIALSGKV